MTKEYYNVQSIIYYPGYDPETLEHDLAIIILELEVQFSKSINRMFLPSEQDATLDEGQDLYGKKCTYFTYFSIKH